MKNSWKGLTIGAFTGAVVGMVLDALSKAEEKVSVARDRLRERAPAAAEWAKHTSARAAERVKEADLAGKAREAVHHAAESDAAGKAKQVGSRAAELVKDADLRGKAREAAHQVAASDAAEAIKKRAAGAKDTARDVTSGAADTAKSTARRTKNSVRGD